MKKTGLSMLLLIVLTATKAAPGNSAGYGQMQALITTPGNNTDSSFIQQQPDTVSYQTFYDELSPYGKWVDYPGYGYVWSPSDPGFRPYYTNGYWSSTNIGFAWVSDYPWGWAPFHYGRWFYETGYGWLWVPGYEWAPAWVCWRNSADCYGWAPLAPGMELGVSVGINIPFEHWAFIPHQYIYERNMGHFMIDERRTESILSASVIINNTKYTAGRTLYATGPRIGEVERYTGTHITPVVIHDHPRPAVAEVNDHEMRVFKPAVQQPHEPVTMRPKEIKLYKDLPHDNGRRGTWSAFAHAREHR
jgi:hypothetical protein